MAELENAHFMIPKVISFLSSLLQRVTDTNDLIQRSETQSISVFHGLTRPTISIQTYLERIFKYANCSPSCFVVSYVYLDRFAERNPTVVINSFSIHRLLITSIMVSAKFMDDMSYNNAYYAKVGGITTIEINFLEVDFLFGLSFHLNVTPTTFHTYCNYLQREMLLESPLNSIDRSLMQHCNFSEDDSTPQT
ncbi:cyclin-U4-1-like isoform X2 [Tasmannia lanceolata]|uniref:cyclin-U4-1-like isoform X2 n=1 Tax=Tasmannia lanceolata TaxID=3420 RepID=UPI00406315CF